MTDSSILYLRWWTPFSMTKGRKGCPGGAECLFVTEPEKYWRHPMAKERQLGYL